MVLLDVGQAADALGVSHVQVGRPIDAGELDAERFGRSWAIDPDSLRRYRLLRPRRGRPLSERASWQRVLDVEPPANIDDAIDLARIVRRRSRNERVRILPALDSRIDDDPRVRNGGTHAAIHHGAGVGRPNQRDIYIHVADVDAFRVSSRPDRRQRRRRSARRREPDRIRWQVRSPGCRRARSARCRRHTRLRRGTPDSPMTITVDFSELHPAAKPR